MTRSVNNRRKNTDERDTRGVKLLFGRSDCQTVRERQRREAVYKPRDVTRYYNYLDLYLYLRPLSRELILLDGVCAVFSNFLSYTRVVVIVLPANILVFPLTRPNGRNVSLNYANPGV